MLAFVLLLTSADPAPPPATCRVAVMDLENQGLPAEKAYLQKTLTEALAAAVADVSGCQVITRQDIAQMLDFEAERLACGGNTSDSCLSEIGNALGVDRIIAGAIARVGATTTVSARLLNLKTGSVDARAEETLLVEEHLRGASQRVGKRLFGTTSTPWSSASADSSSPDSSPGPNLPLLVGGGIVGGAGLVAAGVGGALAVGANGVLSDKDAATAAKDQATVNGRAALVVAGVGVGVVVVGAAVAVAAFVWE